MIGDFFVDGLRQLGDFLEKCRGQEQEALVLAVLK